MRKKSLLLLLSLLWIAGSLHAQNPLVTGQFTADPTARVFEGKIYVYPSHDIPSPIEKLSEWFCMPDYHVFSSENLTDWTDHGVIVDQAKVPWVDASSYTMWAPDCIYKDGKYYFYFPAAAGDPAIGRGSMIGVAIADKPYGPFIPQAEPIKGARGIDPCTFIDKDGQAYIYWCGGGMFVAKLKDNMIELDSEPKRIEGLPAGGGLKEGPFLFERNGKYYYTFPWVIEKTEALVYCIGDSPMGPFEYKGIIMEEWADGCWTNHHSIVEYKDQWYLFYHHNDFSPEFDKNRSMRADSLNFNADGTIQQVKPTLRGIGVTCAKKEIQLDRYSHLSEKGAEIKYLNRFDKFKGWKTILTGEGAWVQYNSVDFGQQTPGKVKFRVFAERAVTLEVRTGGANGALISEVNVPAHFDWIVLDAPVTGKPKDVQNLWVGLKGNGKIEIDWMSFE
ncbi:hypothetical protein M2137_002167 [Parabacteroides sp. PFB2-10]|uniref:family 43 glycosylhydrolase n=1 Tax=Parabacteroides sp. PFB2-10 TaxID=1742405 RepID=UPI0024766443|nr:family 43 glycosylhydrolase [Parabacteroides sp. PFB2-10]MDH6313377.1 hypothetical protein [Parabacteroides sp. PFB2-10]MDL2245299.1 family 43 glycosylhydrolase [Parabacteroides sp. OttesenSCG-928-J18]